MKGRVN